MTRTVALALRDGAARLAGIADNPRQEARLLLAHALDVAPEVLIREPERLVACGAGYEELLERRAAHEPMALILGHWGFWDLDLLVSPATLIPRADSETLIEAALTLPVPPERVLDLGTGTGCLLLALLRVFPAAYGIGVDVVPAAAALAHRNAVRNGLIGRCGFACSDWTNAVSGRFDLVVSNPPYIEAAAIAGLMPEVARFEPATALDGGADGYAAYQAILRQLDGILAPDGVAILELGLGQSEVVADLAGRAGFRTSARLDLGKIPRAMLVSRRGC
jgi:release factor glutamine methyltransferase